VDCDENNRVENTWRYAYSADGKKISEEGWSSAGHLWARSEFDQHENQVRLTWLRDDGAPEREQNWRYQYSREGNVTEQFMVPPDEPQMTYRSVFIRDNDGRLREQVHYWPMALAKRRKCSMKAECSGRSNSLLAEATYESAGSIHMDVFSK
jgi:hypothetical protein